MPVIASQPRPSPAIWSPRPPAGPPVRVLQGGGRPPPGRRHRKRDRPHGRGHGHGRGRPGPKPGAVPLLLRRGGAVPHPPPGPARGALPPPGTAFPARSPAGRTCSSAGRPGACSPSSGRCGTPPTQRPSPPCLQLVWDCLPETISAVVDLSRRRRWLESGFFRAIPGLFWVSFGLFRACFQAAQGYFQPLQRKKPLALLTRWEGGAGGPSPAWNS